MPLFEWCQWLQHTRFATAITVVSTLYWRADGKEILFRGQELDSDDVVMMAADVETKPTFRVDAPKVLFRIPGPVEDDLGAVTRDGQRFVLTINVPADQTEHPAGGQ